jgi:NAD+--asparagine ADP-ribosyltransferase
MNQITPAVYFCSDKYVGNKEYFDALFKEINSPGFKEHFLAYLKSRDISNFDPVRDMPEELSWEVNKDPCVQFIKLLSIKSMCNLVATMKKDTISLDYKKTIEEDTFDGYIQINHLYLMYQAWYQKNHDISKGIDDINTFAEKMKKYCEQKVVSNIDFYKPKSWNRIKSFKQEWSEYKC